MRLRYATLVPAALLALAGCQSPTEPAETRASAPAPVTAAAQASGPAASGGGHFVIEGLDLEVQFAFSALQAGPDGSARGEATHSTTFQGELVEFHTDVTCVTVDAAEGRAWIGGVVRANRSTHPGFTTEIHEPGRDIWFRVVDYGEGAAASEADRATFVGFEGGAGIITSEQYCQEQPWPDDDARTNPVFGGNVQVRP